ncbi:MAG: alpha/beta hydrolase [Myxococcales bacterium]|nr:alpha/beta hydrolase [Myxococcales bacterium]
MSLSSPRSNPLVLVLGLASSLLFGCDSSPPASEGGDPAGGAASAEPTPPPAPPEPPSQEPVRVTFTTEDGVTLVGTFQQGGRADAPAVILLHQLGSNRAEWAELIAPLAESPGLTILSVDLRGHGESTAGPEGSTLDFRSFEVAAWQQLGLDAKASMAFLEAHPSANPSRIVIVGASIGSSAAILAAAEDERIAALALLSPGRAYRGIDAITPLSRLGERPLLALAAREDLHASEAARDMARISSVGHLIEIPGAAHGTAMLRESPTLRARLVAFVREPETFAR